MAFSQAQGELIGFPPTVNPDAELGSSRMGYRSAGVATPGSSFWRVLGELHLKPTPRQNRTWPKEPRWAIAHATRGQRTSSYRRCTV